MRRFFFCLVFLILVGCSHPDLPPSPPPPGGTGAYGQAIGGIPLSNTTLPSWAGPLLYTDISPASARPGDYVTVTVTKPDFVTTKFYIYGTMYYFNKNSSVWQQTVADTSRSGQIVSSWADGSAVFVFNADQSKFGIGNNFIVIYWCLDTGTVDANGNKVWNCNGKKWGLGAFELLSTTHPELIETAVGANTYVNSTQLPTTDGNELDAIYSGPSGIQTTARVLQVANFSSIKSAMALNVPYLSSIWTTMSGACGFSQASVTSSTFTWFTNTSRISIQTAASTVDSDAVAAYAAKYPSNCNLLEEVKRVAAGGTGYCGNSVVEKPEQCDKANDSACPGLCKPDCTCLVRGDSGTGMCGDFLVQQPNSQGVVENCEPPQKRDVVTGQILSGSTCYVRDPFTNAVQGVGHCSEQCGCITGTLSWNPQPSLPFCGNGVCDTGEDTTNCKADCAVDSTAPFVSIIAPTANQTFNTSTVLYQISASDQSAVQSCTAQTDASLPDTMSQTGALWSLSRTASVGSHSITFNCTDAKGLSKQVMNSFSIINTTVPKTALVVFQNLSYMPVTLTINHGDMVNFLNNDTMAHSATADLGSFDTGNLTPSQNKTIQFNTAGIYTYHCSIHSSMHGTIVVQ